MTAYECCEAKDDDQVLNPRDALHHGERAANNVDAGRSV